MTIVDLLVGETRVKYGFEPDVAFAIISRISAQAHALTWTPEQLRRGLGKTIDLEPKVRERAARRLGCTTDELDSWIAARAWDRALSEKEPPRDIAKERKMLEDYGRVKSADYAVPTDTDLAKELALSDLSPAEISIMAEGSKGVVTAEDFAKTHDPHRTDGVGADGFRGYVLGVARTNDNANLRFSTAMNLRNWVYGYDRVLFGFPKAGAQRNFVARTMAFMDTITALDEPIVFLVPRNLNATQHTRDEMRFLLDNPDRMKNVTFVFGAYQG